MDERKKSMEIDGKTECQNYCQPIKFFMKLIPYLNFAGNAEEALNFYSDVLGGSIVLIKRYAEAPMPTDEDYKQKILHARLEFDNNMIMISDAFKGQPVSTNGNIQMSVEME